MLKEKERAYHRALAPANPSSPIDSRDGVASEVNTDTRRNRDLGGVFVGLEPGDGFVGSETRNREAHGLGCAFRGCNGGCNWQGAVPCFELEMTWPGNAGGFGLRMGSR